MFLQDLFAVGSHTKGTPTTAGPGDGGNGQKITEYLSWLTGAYQAVTGSGTKTGPAPAPQAAPTPKDKTSLYVGIGLAVAVVAFFMFRKR